MGSMRVAAISFSFFAVSLQALPALALEVHVAPGASGGDGTASAPFGSVGEALGAASSGDTIWLHEGDYGDLAIDGAEGVTLAAAAGEQARLRTLAFGGSTDVIARGLSISLSYGEPYERATMVQVNGSSSGITVEDCDIFSTTDDVVAGWAASDWADLPGTGMSSRAPDSTFRDNRIRNVGYGISIAHDSPNARVVGNVIDGFSRDGLRGVGDFGLFEGNVVKNAYDVDDHHDDFFQSWSVGSDGSPGTGVVRGVVIRGNLFIGVEDPEQPFAGAAQGIGCFDGFFEDWVIENNVVVVNHWHGITLMGARNVRIVNNTVFDDRRGTDPGPPWIRVVAHKDGTPSENVVIRNNLAATITLEANDSVEDHNLRFDDPAALFVDSSAYDFHLLEGSAAVDAGSSEDAPAFDFEGIPRPQGDAVDLGAFEWHDGSVTPTPDAAVAPGDDGGPSEPSDGGSNPGVDGGAEGEGGDEGCGCASSGSGGGWLPLTLVLFALRRRRPASSRPSQGHR